MSNSSTADLGLNLGSPRADLILTAGNVWRRDDGAGPYVASRLRALGSRAVVDAGERPEDIMDEVVARHPRHVILVDAADFGSFPGDIRAIPEEALPETSLSTHRIPLSVVARLFQKDTGCKLTFVGIQCGDISMGEGLTEEVRLACERLAAFLRNGTG
ncbi:MAG: hydrogenase 3 maturation endopeptidase HyCI [Candidatus Omnitrophica bacterium]|nr:hydrogenase 3 maturation endopeptidase HyCI [Candidatus Omnitrophota bacterium]